MHPPDFWSRDNFAAKIAAAAISPLGWAYGASVAWKRDHVKRHRPRARTVCVGNLTVGGTGKTPVAIAIARALSERHANVVILTRGYSGSAQGPLLVDPARHSAQLVGDEALLLAGAASTIVARDRKKGACLADARGADVIVMDDGHQNFALEKDFSILVVDGAVGFGNGNVVPSGPLREPVAQGLARADAIIHMGDGNLAFPGFEGCVLRARLEPRPRKNLAGARVVAFAGIGRTEKFFDTLRAIGAEVAGTHTFPDHYFYAATDIVRLRADALRTGAILITTEKDHVRLAEEDRHAIWTLPVRAVFEDMAAFDNLLDNIGVGGS